MLRLFLIERPQMITLFIFISAFHLSISSAGECANALKEARALDVPRTISTTHGDIENADFWDDNDELLQQARKEWGKEHVGLYRFDEEFISEFLDPKVKEALEQKSTARMKSVVRTTEKEGVFKIKMFNEKFVDSILDELSFQEKSKIPMRRPNGMNRYGCILNELGFEEFLKGLSDRLLKPIAQILFSRRVSVQDLTTEYGFVVQYHPASDVNLAEHADASAITANICLLPSKEDAPLFFKNVREIGETTHDVEPVKVALDIPGEVVFHLGQHIHGVSNVTSSRSNMVVWLMGDYGYVRVAPYDEHEILANQLSFEKNYGWN